MFRNVSPPYSSTPVAFSDIHTAGHHQQQQQHFSLLNLNSSSGPGLTASTSIKNFSTHGKQTLPKKNETSQQQRFLEHLFNSVALREKTTSQLHEIRKTRRRLSDSLLIQQQQQQHPHISLIGNIHSHLQQQQQQQQQQAQSNLNFQPEQNNTLTRRRSVRFHKIPSIPQTIHQRSSPFTENESQKLFVIRHGERVDSTFGSNWLDQVFDKAGVYQRTNLNLPKKMVTRKDLKDFSFDPPLTELGLHQCKIIGEELAAQGVKIDYIYSSPALRCVQTADKILEGLEMREKISIRIEPCLFEFLKWYSSVPVKWPFLDLDELTQNGYNVDKTYKPFYPIESLRKDEDELMFYARSHLIATSILKNHDNQEGNLLLVGHASTIEVCTRQLIGGQPRINDLKFLVLRVPFLSMHCISKQTDGTWKATKPPISPNKHAAVEPFDWRFFR